MLRTSFSRVASVLACLAALAGAPSRTHACTCHEYPTFEEARDGSAAIFRGTVTAITPAPSHLWYGQGIWVTFDVNAWWKGTPAPTATILTGQNDGICGFLFEIGTEYLVYAELWTPGDHLMTHLCWRTHRARSGDPDIDALGPPITLAVEERSWGIVKELYR